MSNSFLDFDNGADSLSVKTKFSKYDKLWLYLESDEYDQQADILLSRKQVVKLHELLTNVLSEDK